MADLRGAAPKRTQHSGGIRSLAGEVCESELGDPLEGVLALRFEQGLEDDEQGVDFGGGRHKTDCGAIERSTATEVSHRSHAMTPTPR